MPWLPKFHTAGGLTVRAGDDALRLNPLSWGAQARSLRSYSAGTKKGVRLPPIVTILSEFLMWILTGVLGVAIATPLAAAVLASCRTLYLHERIEH